MNIAIIGYGRAGCRIAETFRRYEARTFKHVSELTLAIDSSAKQLRGLDRIDDDHQLLIGQSEFEGRGTGRDLEPGVSICKRNAGKVVSATDQLSKFEVDAFVVIGALAGGTGGGGAPVIAQSLSSKWDKPVYGVGILPSKDEPDTYTLNAARSIQSFSRETTNLLLFDNDHLGVAEPGYNPDVPDDADPDRVFNDVNQDIARALHLLFTADEISPPSHLEGSTITTEDIISTLETGGISTFSYTSEPLPKAARPGIRGRFWELVDYLKTWNARRRHDQWSETQARSSDSEQRHHTTLGTDTDDAVGDLGDSEPLDSTLWETDETPSESGSTDPVDPLFNDADPEPVDDLTPDADTDTRTLVPDADHDFDQPSHEPSDETPSLPAGDVDETDGVNNEADESNGITGLLDDDDDAESGVGGSSEASVSVSEHAFSDRDETAAMGPEKPTYEREWPHPTDLIPGILNPEEAMLDCKPAYTSRNLFLLVGPGHHLSWNNPADTTEWAEQNTSAGRATAGNYPAKNKNVAALVLSSGLAIPDRVLRLQQDAAEIATRIIEKQAAQPNPKEQNVFDRLQTDVPPSF